MKLHSPDPDGGGGSPAETPAPPANNPPSPSSPAATPPAPAPPAAAAAVLSGDKTEKELQLEKELESERSARKKVELDNAQLSDELHRAKAGPAVPPPVKQRPSCKRGPLGVRAD